MSIQALITGSFGNLPENAMLTVGAIPSWNRSIVGTHCGEKFDDRYDRTR